MKEKKAHISFRSKNDIRFIVLMASSGFLYSLDMESGKVCIPVGLWVKTKENRLYYSLSTEQNSEWGSGTS